MGGKVAKQEMKMRKWKQVARQGDIREMGRKGEIQEEMAKNGK